MPKTGMVVPNMGIVKRQRQRRAASLADALFSTTQQRVLGLIFGQPLRSFYATELIGLIGAGSGAVQRELARLENSGLVTVSRVGTQKHYQANPASPIYSELCSIAQKTVGLAEPLREVLGPLVPKVRAAFVYGSVAKREDTAASDIDLMLISEEVEYADLFALLEEATSRLGRAVNPTVLTPKSLARKVKEGDAFVNRVLSQPKIWLIGSDGDLAI